MKYSIYKLGAGIVLAAALGACSDSSVNANGLQQVGQPGPGPVDPGPDPDPDPAPVQFAEFVSNQVATRTDDQSEPAAINDIDFAIADDADFTGILTGNAGI